jgi:2-dehydropantoate 2-reductase
MRILVVGPGAVGCYFGGLLARGGHEVVFAARPATAVALRTNGIRVEGTRGSWQIAPVQAISDAGAAEQSDVALMCVKLYDTASATAHWQSALQKTRAIVSLQNGMDGIDRLRAAWSGPDGPTAYAGLAYVAGQLLAPGHVRTVSSMSRIQFGGPGAANDATLQSFTEACRHAEVDAECREDIASAQWAKFAALATNAALTCLTRQPAGVCFHDDELLKLARQSIDEVIATANAAGAALAPSLAADTLGFLQALPADMFASMHHDLVAGKPLELDGLSGYVVRAGLRHGVATPFHHMAWSCLRPWAQGKLPR